MKQEIIPVEYIHQRIFLIRGYRVMLSFHLAELYGVETRVLVQAVKRNIKRFSQDFMFQLTWDEVEVLKSQNVILKTEGRGKHIKYLPYAFTEQSVAMLSSVLNSERAIRVNITIMRAFVKLREMVSLNKELAKKLEELEHKLSKHDKEITTLFQAIKELMIQSTKEKIKRRIGFV
jgi:hypothetical protein